MYIRKKSVKADKELKNMSRRELLELLLEQTKEKEKLQEEVDSLHAKLSDRNLRFEKAGNLAQAVLEINGVMEAAQAAAQQYLDNIARMEQELKEEYDNRIVKTETV